MFESFLGVKIIIAIFFFLWFIQNVEVNLQLHVHSWICFSHLLMECCSESWKFSLMEDWILLTTMKGRRWELRRRGLEKGRNKTYRGCGVRRAWWMRNKSYYNVWFVELRCGLFCWIGGCEWYDQTNYWKEISEAFQGLRWSHYEDSNCSLSSQYWNEFSPFFHLFILLSQYQVETFFILF